MNNQDDRTRSGRLFSPDARLAAIASLIPRGARLWDVGSDHGLLPVWLLNNGLVSSAVASDISEKPLASARKTAERFSVALSLRLCDGLPPDAENAADVYVIAGMGGGTIAGILSAAPWTRSAKLILQPMSSAEDLRALLYGAGYRITNELYVRDGQRGYVVITTDGECETHVPTLAQLVAGDIITDEHYLSKCLVHIKNLAKSGDYDTVDITQAVDIIERRLRSDG